MIRRALVACALDIDGVLVKGNKPIKGALESIKALQEHKIPFVCLTNGGGVLERMKAEKLSWILTKDSQHPTTSLIQPHQMILSHSPMKILAHKYANEDVLIVGGGDDAALMQVVKSYGFHKAIHISDYVHENPNLYPTFPRKKYDHVSDEEWEMKLNADKCHTEHNFKAIMVMYDSDHVGRDAQVIIDIMRSKGTPGLHLHNHPEHHVNLYMSHQDFLYSSNFVWPRFGQGFLKMTLEHIYKNLAGHELRMTMFGKPHPSTYRFAEECLLQQFQQLQRPGEQIENRIKYYGVGDNPMSDIAGANQAGNHWHSVLTRTGVFNEPDQTNDKTHPADYVVQDISEFVQQLIHNEL